MFQNKFSKIAIVSHQDNISVISCDSYVIIEILANWLWMRNWSGMAITLWWKYR